ncbi:40S ribosomal protein S15-like [Coffea eugenioides]|uniref:40S ribosomal protein S15-like n=1 Tax=Coffea eugenioides TaxID=49369 RepID=UPI000F610933|nr:40S ribosomal protein S15-like [Coffea eugenioides]
MIYLAHEIRALVKLFHARASRRFNRGLKRKPMALEGIMIIVLEMIGSVIGVYNGKSFNTIEVKPKMIGHYLAEFSISYKPVKHGRPGIGATHSSRFIPLK